MIDETGGVSETNVSSISYTWYKKYKDVQDINFMRRNQFIFLDHNFKSGDLHRQLVCSLVSDIKMHKDTLWNVAKK